MNNSIIYVVPRVNFFSEGYRGRVMHALGIVEGIFENGRKIIIVGGSGLKSFKKDLPDGVEIIEIEEKKGWINKIFWYQQIFNKIKSVYDNSKVECLIIRYNISGYFYILFLANKFKKITGVLEVNYFAHQAYLNSVPILNKMIVLVERFLVNKFDILYLISDKAAADKRIQGIRSTILSIPNGVTSKEIKFGSFIKKDSRVTRLLYLGSIMYYWDWNPIIKAFKDKRDLNYELHFYGDGPKLEFLKTQLIKTDGVFFHGKFSRNELGKIINPETDILYLPPKTIFDMKNTGGLSTKAFDYLSMKTPIIVPHDEELNNIYTNLVNCLMYDRNKPREINETVSVLSEDRSLRLLVTKNAYNDYKKKYSWKSRMKFLIHEI